MNEILEIVQKLKRFTNFKIAFDLAAVDILKFTGVQRIILFKKEITEPKNVSFLKFYMEASLSGYENSYLKQNFDESVFLKDYMSIYAEALITNNPISFNPKLLNPKTDKALFEFFDGKDVKSCLIIPLILHNEVWGAIVFHDLEQTRDLGREIFSKAKLVSELISSSITICEHENKTSIQSIDEHSYRMASLGKLAASIAHEMNNQIFMINGFAAKIDKFLTLNPDYFHEDVKKYLDSIQNSCNRSAEIVEALRVTTRSTKHEQLEVCDINYLITSLVNLSKEKAIKENISFEVLIPSDELLIECKPGQVMQVLTNLINNSFDALESVKTAKVIKISCRTKNDEVIVEFSDSGAKPGDEIILNMMEPFFSTKPLGKGCGLGLSICKQIMRKFNGDIILDHTKPNTTFLLSFPCVLFEDNN